MEQEHRSKPSIESAAGIVAGASTEMLAGVTHRYRVECVRDGKVIWADEFDNLVTTDGKNKYLDATLKTGLAAPAWYVGLVTGPGAGNTYLAANTHAVHAGWVEDVTYSDSTRPAWTPGSIAAGSVSNTAAKAVFAINGTATIAGCFMADVATKGDTGAGTLLGVGNFTAGDRLVQSGDTLNVTMTAVQV